MQESAIVDKSDYSVKETKEAIMAILMLSKVLIKNFGDGVDLSGIPDLIKDTVFDDNFREILGKAWAGRDFIDDEMKNISIAEVTELAMLTLNGVLDIMKTTK